MKHIICLCVLLVVSIAFASGDTPLDGGFEEGGESWVIVGDPQAVQTTTQRPARGRLSLMLEATESSAAWAVSAPLTDLPTGPLEMSLRARHISGDAQLAAAFVSTVPDTPDDIAPLWHISLPADGKWHRLQVGLVIPPNSSSSWCLAIGLMGGEGLWQVDDVALDQYTPPNVQPGPSADIPAASAPAPLPDDWSPDGDLDATRRQVGTEEELVLTVDGLRITSPDEATLARGFRQGLLTYVTNRGDVRKQLRVSIQGPAGIYIADYTVPILPRRTTRFFPPMQMLNTGDGWLKITFSSGTESGSMPVRVQCRRSYPAFGLTVPDPRLLVADTIAPSWRPLPAQFYHFPCTDSQSASVAAEAMSAREAEFSLQLPIGAQDNPDLLITRLRELNVAPKLVFVAPYLTTTTTDVSGSELVANIQRYIEQMEEALPAVRLASPLFSLSASDTGLRPARLLNEALEAGLGGLVDWLAVGLPAVALGGVLEEQVDGKPRPKLNLFWADLDRRLDFAPLRAYLSSAGTNNPFVVLNVRPTGTGDQRLDALLAARILISALAEGAVAATVAAHPEDNGGPSQPDSPLPSRPIYAVFQELTRELSGAVPLAYLADTSGFSGRQGCPITYRAFRRGNEGIVFMWNNTSVPIDVAVQLHCMPIQLHILRLSYHGDLVTRQFQGLFSFSEEAQRNEQSAVYVRVAPLQIIGLSFNLKNAHSGWLRMLGPRPPIQQRRRPEIQQDQRMPWRDQRL